MLLKRKVLICLAAVTICLSGIALAKAVKQELVNEDGEIIGKANLNYAKGANKTECQVNGWDLDTETEYIVLLCVCDDDGEVTDCTEVGSFTTNKKGKGHLHASVEGDVSDWCVVFGVLDDSGYYVVPLGWWGTGWPSGGPYAPILPLPIPGVF